MRSVSPLWGGADPRIMTSAVTDIQYAMTFDLASGRRLTPLVILLERRT